MTKYTSDIVSDWADLFTDRRALQEAVDLNAPAEFQEKDLDRIHKWCVRLYNNMTAEEPDETAVLDREDDAILLRLHQLKRGWLREHGRRLVYDHLMIDEVQDFSPLEAAVLMDTVPKGRPVTFAGDTAQKIVRESGFVSWNDLLADLGLHGYRIAPLEVAYRSTAEVMTFAYDVLGPYAERKPIAARRGAPVSYYQFGHVGQAVGFLGDALRDLARREPLANVAVLARYAGQARIYYDGLTKTEIPNLRLVLAEDFSFKSGVEVTEVRQVKGLEFDYVVLVDVNHESYPDNEESRHLLYVGATRAAHQLWLISRGTPSPILPETLLGAK
jgi:DNA helicase-2/ATP-dependent DNA helicase PcrA